MTMSAKPTSISRFASMLGDGDVFRARIDAKVYECTVVFPDDRIGAVVFCSGGHHERTLDIVTARRMLRDGTLELLSA